MKETKEKLSRVRSTINFKLKKSDMEIPRGKSQTVQDDSWTLIELLQRHQAGIALSQKRGQHDLDEESDDFDSVDMNQFQQLENTEQALHAEPHLMNVEALKRSQAKKAKEDAKVKAEAELKAKIDAEIEARKAKSEGETKTPKKD